MLILIIAGIVAGVASSSSSPSSAPASNAQHSTTTTTTESPVASCGLNLGNWVIFVFNNSNTGLDDASLTYGTQSGIWRWIAQESETFNQNVNSGGQSQADSVLSTDSGSECASLQGQGFQIGEIPPPPASAGDPAPAFNGAPAQSSVQQSSTATTQAPTPIPAKPSSTTATQTPPAALTQALDAYFSNPANNVTPLDQLTFTAKLDPNDSTWALWTVGPASGYQGNTGYGYAQESDGAWEIVAGPGSDGYVGCSASDTVPATVLSAFGTRCPANGSAIP